MRIAGARLASENPTQHQTIPLGNMSTAICPIRVDFDRGALDLSLGWLASGSPASVTEEGLSSATLIISLAEI